MFYIKKIEDGNTSFLIADTCDRVVERHSLNSLMTYLKAGVKIFGVYKNEKNKLKFYSCFSDMDSETCNLHSYDVVPLSSLISFPNWSYMGYSIKDELLLYKGKQVYFNNVAVGKSNLVSIDAFGIDFDTERDAERSKASDGSSIFWCEISCGIQLPDGDYLVGISGGVCEEYDSGAVGSIFSE